jgi:hypothetical protein
MQDCPRTTAHAQRLKITSGTTGANCNRETLPSFSHAKGHRHALPCLPTCSSTSCRAVRAAGSEARAASSAQNRAKEVLGSSRPLGAPHTRSACACRNGRQQRQVMGQRAHSAPWLRMSLTRWTITSADKGCNFVRLCGLLVPSCCCEPCVCGHKTRPRNVPGRLCTSSDPMLARSLDSAAQEWAPRDARAAAHASACEAPG